MVSGPEIRLHAELIEEGAFIVLLRVSDNLLSIKKISLYRSAGASQRHK